VAIVGDLPARRKSIFQGPRENPFGKKSAGTAAERK
jgi:hypothetical protein